MMLPSSFPNTADSCPGLFNQRLFAFLQRKRQILKFELGALFILFYWDNLISITVMYYFHIQGKNTIKNIPGLGGKKDVREDFFPLG